MRVILMKHALILTVLLGAASALHATVSANINTTEVSSRYNIQPGPHSMDFHACKTLSPDDSIYEVKSITLDPYPPRKKKDVRIVVRGILKDKIDQGAYVKVTVSKGILKHTLDFDFCKGIIQGCPVGSGDVEFWTGQYISGLIPSGKATIMVKPFTTDGRMMSCVEVPVVLQPAI